jgi:spoIIIJ-associated protein
VEERDGELVGTLDGDDLGRFIGHHGQTIEAVQHLAYRIVARGEPGLRVSIDAGGYREQREDALRAQADRAAEDALSRGRPASMEAMSATERRFVHEYLRERGDVETYSEGEEPDRRLVVAPVT